jgi:hypothetical protein
MRRKTPTPPRVLTWNTTLRVDLLLAPHVLKRERWLTYWLGRALGGVYAKWCVRQMLDGASTHVAVQPAAAA